MQISAWVSSQKLRLISAAVQVNQQFLCCWRLRNQHELDAVIESSARRSSCTGCTSRRRGNLTVSSSSPEAKDVNFHEPGGVGVKARFEARTKKWLFWGGPSSHASFLG